MKLTVHKKHLKLFIQDLWKDARQLEVETINGSPVIRRYSDSNVSIAEEFAFLQRLRGIVSIKIPEIVAHDENHICFQYIVGTRVFNLLMDLKELYQLDSDIGYFDVCLQLKQELQENLGEFQAAVAKDPLLTKIKKRYPAEKKVLNVYRLLTSILPDLVFSDDLAEDLNGIIRVYTEHSSLPFRDATPKNAILSIPALFQRNFSSKKERLSAVAAMVKSGELKHLITKERVYHIDFSGCLFLCPVSDDWIALKQHEATQWLSGNSSACSDEDDAVELCTKFVRFTRFGGRKLAYRFLNRSGHAIRFGRDNERYYFAALEEICARLRELEIVEHRRLTDVVNSLSLACSYQAPTDYLHDFMKEAGTIKYYSDIYPN
ncbi:MAG: hypothetical protein GY866_25345 [Proteobacteria bacterium]|nr:hypothetical protein [Pseudomonadota bacterium]